MGHACNFWYLLVGVAIFWDMQNALNSSIREAKAEARIVKEAIGENTYYAAL